MASKIYFSATGRKAAFRLPDVLLPLDGGSFHKVEGSLIVLDPEFVTDNAETQMAIEKSPWFGTGIVTAAPDTAPKASTVAPGPGTIGTPVVTATGVTAPAEEPSEFQNGKGFEDMTVSQLREVSKEFGVAYNGLDKKALVAALQAAAEEA